MSDEVVVYLVRHGLHDWLRPESNRLAGRTPGIALNEEGRREAARAAALLADRPLRWIAASPIERTMETARLIARPHRLEVVPDRRFLEWALGPWEGMWIEEIRRRYPEEWRTWRERPLALRLPDAETLEEVADRMEEGCRAWMARGGEGVIVSHQDPIAALLARLIGMPLDGMRSLHISTGSISAVRRSAFGIAVESINTGVMLV
ncbi:MAG TPA: histidine phosphatase family protein [bacterium]|nr:histidine phosphatase family protein [bacterium]